MPTPTYCPNPRCRHHGRPRGSWYHHFGSYETAAHGTVQRYQCTHCGKTFGDQTESLHYYAKRRLPLRAIWITLAGGASVREVSHRYRTTPMAVQSAVLRLGRQAMAGQAWLLHHLEPRRYVCFDGLRSFVTAQDYPCDITTVVDRPGETILTMVNTVMLRGGTMTPRQRTRFEAKKLVWRPRRGIFKNDITRLLSEIWSYLRPTAEQLAIIATDEHPLYRSVINRNAIVAHFRRREMFAHLRTAGSAARTPANRLFPVNYVDRMMRHRVKEHMRETIAGGRHAALQMHRAWLFAWELNARRPWRVRQPAEGLHATHSSRTYAAAVAAAVPSRIQREFFTRRIRLYGCHMPETMRQVWRAELPTPPLRWRKPQKGTTVVIPLYAIRDLAQANPQAS